MKIRLLAILTSILMLACVGCETAPPYDPFVKEEAEIKTAVSVISMRPLLIPDFSRKEEVAERYEQLITERLEAAGFTVIPSAEFSAVWDPMLEELGGLYDPVTGESDPEKVKAINEHTTSELIRKFAINAYAAPRIELTKAGWYGNTASWDGVKDETTGKSGFWAALGAANYSGSVPAISLILPVYSVNGDVLYVGRGGVQLFAHFQGGRFVDIPEHMWFTEPERDANAVVIATDPLLGESAVLHASAVE